MVFDQDMFGVLACPLQVKHRSVVQKLTNELPYFLVKLGPVYLYHLEGLLQTLFFFLIWRTYCY